MSLAPVEYSSLWVRIKELLENWGADPSSFLKPHPDGDLGTDCLGPDIMRMSFHYRHIPFKSLSTWLPAYPCGPVPHYVEGRHLGPLWTPHMFQATCASRLTHRKSPRQPPPCRNVAFSITEFELTRSIKVTVNSPLSTNTLIQSPRRKNSRLQAWLYNPVNNLTLPAMTRSHAVLCKMDNFAQSCSKKTELMRL